jgi:hypothetical protein
MEHGDKQDADHKKRKEWPDSVYMWVQRANGEQGRMNLGHPGVAGDVGCSPGPEGGPRVKGIRLIKSVCSLLKPVFEFMFRND